MSEDSYLTIGLSVNVPPEVIGPIVRQASGVDVTREGIVCHFANAELHVLPLVEEAGEQAGEAFREAFDAGVAAAPIEFADRTPEPVVDQAKQVFTPGPQGSTELLQDLEASAEAIADGRFTCPEPGCGRRFASAQGLGGHKGTHSKQTIAEEMRARLVAAPAPPAEPRRIERPAPAPTPASRVDTSVFPWVCKCGNGYASRGEMIRHLNHPESRKQPKLHIISVQPEAHLVPSGVRANAVHP